ncbi:centrosomal protein of 72 kDa isoform X1 [Megalobrama amblycephala]|uniref:centrosomal protein of 72 kDa isoform X1 n=1 Tax=Megalobrama amblycephala TaxID=75352 RepID=UPI002013DAC0|nr:centrosomal protein of 72 kDa isoform X1 [Megalobrama amblycephala]
MAVDGLTITEQWIREKLNLQHSCLADVRSLTLPGTYEGKICHLGTSLKNFVRLKTLDLSHNALVTVQGIEHLEMLERLNLYYNRLASLQDVFSLHKLQNLKELDLRLNPVVKRHPHYRLYLVHAMTKLRKLDDRPVRDRERKAALMHFSSEANLDTNHKKHVLTQDTTCSSELRIKAMQKMMKTLSLLEGNEEVALNDVSSKTWNSKRPQTLSVRSENECSPHLLQENPSESEIIHLINDSDCETLPKQNQESVPKSSDYKNEASVRSHRVTFVSPIMESRQSVRSVTVRGEHVFTPHPTDTRSASQELDCTAIKWRNQHQDRANPVLHPPRLTYQNTGTSDRSPTVSERRHKPQKGAYRKPMELLLSMMEELWSGKEENQQNRTFLMKMVQILSMMEQDVVGGEQEIQTLKETLKALTARNELQEKQRQSEIEDLTLQLQQTQESITALNEQLKNVLEENVSLQKQLIRAEKKLLSSHLKKTPNMESRRELSVPEDLNVKRHTIQEGNGANEQLESYRTLIARNERLLQQLEEALMS